jgi:hypothetical protein
MAAREGSKRLLEDAETVHLPRDLVRWRVRKACEMIGLAGREL